MKMKNIKQFWNTCRGNYAHIRDNWKMTPRSKRAKELNKHFFDKYDFSNKTVIDYGCGGGFVGLYMFQYLKIHRYIGIDISERSIRKARKVLYGYYIDFTNELQEFGKIDFLISIACIQHFHSKEYLEDFLRKINKSKISVLMLQIRNGDKYSDIKDEEITDENMFYCYTNTKFLNSHLNNYKLVYESEVNKKSYGQYLIYEVKK
ncbi:MAG: class I SAM-dependent methyltransferase [Thermoplasmatales archaeon]|nr:MAG: class I SAM-dependent methyltransferase [Thermoplasmatales archaeon]